MLDAKMESAVAKEMIKGAPDTMYSEFHLGYNMLLNLLQIEGSEPEHLMAASFRQFQVQVGGAIRMQPSCSVYC
jgi:ATP-dependent RNA helicase DOB1